MQSVFYVENAFFWINETWQNHSVIKHRDIWLPVMWSNGDNGDGSGLNPNLWSMQPPTTQGVLGPGMVLNPPVLPTSTAGAQSNTQVLPTWSPMMQRPSMSQQPPHPTQYGQPPFPQWSAGYQASPNQSMQHHQQSQQQQQHRYQPPHNPPPSFQWNGVQQQAKRAGPPGMGHPNSRYENNSRWNGAKVDQGTPWEMSGTGGSVNHMGGGASAQSQYSAMRINGGNDSSGKYYQQQWPIQSTSIPPPSMEQQAMNQQWNNTGGWPTQQENQQWQQPATGGYGAFNNPPPINQNNMQWQQPNSYGGQYGSNSEMYRNQPGSDYSNMGMEANVAGGVSAAGGGGGGGDNMYWQDPSPRNKRIQRDTGVQHWGDPANQLVDIRRWKDPETEDFPQPESQDQQTASSWAASQPQVVPDPTGWGDLPSDDGWKEPSPEEEAAKAAFDRINGLGLGFTFDTTYPMNAKKINIHKAVMPRITRLEQAVGDLEEIKKTLEELTYSNLDKSNAAREFDRITAQIETLNNDLAYLSSEFNAASEGQGQSKLSQWTKVNDGVDQLIGAVNGISIDEAVNNGYKHSLSPGPSNTNHDGFQEFIPGKKWEWRDPSKRIMEDPNATPGSVVYPFGTPVSIGIWSMPKDFKDADEDKSKQ